MLNYVDFIIFIPCCQVMRYNVNGITNGSITDVWSSNYSLSENDLHEYTYEEQLNNYRFLKKYEKTKVVGYYKANQGDN